MRNFFKKSFLLSCVVLGLVTGFYTFSAKSYAAGNNAESFDAAALFKKRCATCHGNDGRAKNFRGRVMHATNLTDANWQNDVSNEHIYNVISGGKKICRLSKTGFQPMR